MAVAILATIIGVIMGTFYVAINAWKVGIAEADSRHRSDAVVDQVCMALRSAYYPQGQPTYSCGFAMKDDGDDAETSRDIIEWTKLGNTLVGEDCTFAGVPHRVVLTVLTGGDAPQGDGLYVKAWRLDYQPEDFDPEKDVEPLMLSPVVVGFDCQMLDPNASAQSVSDEIPWISEWPTSNRIPRSVKISLAIQPDKEDEKPYVVSRLVEIPMAELSFNPGVGGRGPRRGR